MSTDIVHQYFVDKARDVFTRASGDPDSSFPLAQWAERAFCLGDYRLGVVVSANGEILAETFHISATACRPGATYVRSVTLDSDADQVGREVGLALGAFRRAYGPAIHVTFSAVCRGPGR